MTASTSNETAQIATTNLLAAFDSADPIHGLSEQLQGLTGNVAPDVAALLSARGEGLGICLGAVLSLINEQDWWKPDYESFDAFCFERCHFHVRQAQHLVRTYEYLEKAAIPWKTVKGLGWTKLRMLVNAKVITAENAPDWAKKAGKMTVKALQANLSSSTPASTPAQPTNAGGADKTSSKATGTPSGSANGGGTDGDEDVETLPKPAEQVTRAYLAHIGFDAAVALLHEVFPGETVAPSASAQVSKLH